MKASRATVLLLAAVVVSCSGRRSDPAAPVGLQGGAASIDELADGLLDGLGRGDREALEALRVSRTEYLEFILPGSRPPNEAPRPYPQHAAEYAWGTHDTRSRYALQALLRARGGRRYRRERVEFREGTRAYRWFTAYNQTSIWAVDEQGKEVEILLGAIVEADGRYRFVSYLAD
jgi:hypothetical protein